jgi:6-phosphogluconolactonase
MAQIHRFNDPQALAKGAASFLIKRGQAAQAAERVFSLALSGGSTPEATYRVVAEQVGGADLDWERVRFFWGDERCVPPDDPASNFRMARQALINHLPVPEDHVFRMACEGDPEQGAMDYEATLRQQFGELSLPQFDLILLGLGPDGHTASLFPGTKALDSGGRWVLPNFVEKMDAWRMTLSLEVINSAAAVAFLVQGAEKAEVLSRVLEAGGEASPYPAAHVRPVSGELHWFVDAAAAARL